MNFADTFNARSTLSISILLAASGRENEIITAYADTIISFIKIRPDNGKIAGVKAVQQDQPTSVLSFARWERLLTPETLANTHKNISFIIFISF